MDELLTKHKSNDKNPYTVNFITYSGHGFTCEGDAIAVIPEYDEYSQKGIVRFINFSGYARRFANNTNNLSIFLMSMCRVYIPTDSDFYRNLKNDALNKQQKYQGSQ